MIPPWFARPTPSKIDQIAVIGAGISGCALAYRLSKAGLKVLLFEQETSVACSASGNPLALLSPYFTADRNRIDEFYSNAFYLTRQVLLDLEQAKELRWHWLDGLVQLALPPHRETQYLQCLRDREIHPSVAEFLAAHAVSDAIGTKILHPGLLIQNAGVVDPIVFCQKLLAASEKVELHFERRITRLARTEEGLWSLTDDRDKTILASHVVLANAHSALQFAQAQAFPVAQLPGQVTLVAKTPLTGQLLLPIVYQGYLTPAFHGQHVCGSSYRHDSLDLAERASDHENNFSALAKALPDFALALKSQPCQARVAVRANTNDHLPLVGPLATQEVFFSDYRALAKGALAKRQSYVEAKYESNLYGSFGFGSRGLTGALLAAELIASLMLGLTLPVSEGLYGALHPSRFWERALRRGIFPKSLPEGRL